jgi:hypothetical protein
MDASTRRGLSFVTPPALAGRGTPCHL